MNNLQENIENNNLNLLPVISGLFTGVVILSNILAVKILHISFLVFDGGTLLFPFSYILGDILAEVYGLKISKKIIFTGFVMLAFSSLNIYIIHLLPAQNNWNLQEDFDNILLQLPRITLGSLAGFFIGSYLNAVTLIKIKMLTKEKYLWMRTIGSTIIGEFADSAIFSFVAFFGICSSETLIAMIFSNYIFKVAIEVIFTPVTYKVIGYINKYEKGLT